MKKLFFVVLFMCIAIIDFGCSDYTSAPESGPNDQSAILAKVKTTFTGTSTFVAALEPGTVTPLPNGKVLVRGVVREWYDEATDPLVTGATIWYINAKINADGSRELWGKGDLFVEDPTNPSAPPVGKWEMTWHGSMDTEGNVIDYVVGTGKEGIVNGFVAKWIYRSHYYDPPPPVGNPFYYDVEGYILSSE